MSVVRQSLTLGPNDQAGSLSCAVTVNAGAGDRLMVVAIHCEDASSDASSPAPKFGVVPLTPVPGVYATEAGTWSSVEWWYLLSPQVATANVTATIVGAGADRGKLAVWVFEGVDQTTPLRNSVENHGESPSVSCSATVAGVISTDYVIDALTLDSTGHAQVEGANQTEDYDVGNGASSSFEMGGTHQSGANGGVMSRTWTTGCPFSFLATAVIEAAGAATPQTVLPDADVVTTGWTTAPLFSKVNDGSDATLITATAS